jgi:pentatricopeptide repeat protein
MLDKCVTPNRFTYNTLLNGYCSLGKWNDAIRILKEMSRVGQKPDVVTCNTMIDYLCKNGRCAEARQIFDSMVEKGENPDVLLYGYAMQGNFIEMTCLIDVMVQNEIPPDPHVFSILINAYGKHGMVDNAMLNLMKCDDMD